MQIPTRRSQLALLIALLVLSGFTIYAHKRLEPARAISTNLFRHLRSVTPDRLPPVTKPVVATTSKPPTPPAPAIESITLEPAQSGGSYNITQSVIPGGGGVSANGNTSVNGTLGQGLSATSSGGQYSVSSGFVSNTCPAITLTTTSLPNGTVNAAYNQTLAASGGTGSYTFTLSTGSLPNGVTLSGAGVLSGIPLASGAFNFSVAATDGQSCTGARTYTLTINCQTITVNPLTLAPARKGVPYSQGFTQTGGVGAVTFVLTGNVPPGLAFNAVTASLSGTPTLEGSFNFIITTNDTAGCNGQRAYTLVVLRRNAVIADFDGDGKTDLSIFSPSAAPPLPNWSVINSGNNATVTQQWGAGYAPYFDDIVPGDYDGDGKADHAIWRGADSIWYIRKSSDGQAILQFWGANYAPYFDIPTPGDYDGDGKTDIGVFRRSGTWFVRRSSDGQNMIVTHGQQDDIPVPADYDGDGKTDLAVFRPGAIAPAPNWIILNSSTNTVTSIQWGAGYAPYFDTPVPADYDGDGKADLAIWRGADSIWYIRKSSDGQAILQFWGANYAPYFDIPTPGDYDGDGKADIAVWRRSGTWFVKLSSDGSFLGKNQGQSGDIPVPAYGVR
ncbi:MAG: VCBS repeat-containing protein [Acidobacteria bacterium]|nr:VCBS repeat-containing protein [Acidobacteriota bacterium]MBI3423501.1 VCBS repeat-containing protein [Acidobacteriota bacterium]